jgi:hypothetical protein
MTTTSCPLMGSISMDFSSFLGDSSSIVSSFLLLIFSSVSCSVHCSSSATCSSSSSSLIDSSPVSSSNCSILSSWKSEYKSGCSSVFSLIKNAMIGIERFKTSSFVFGSRLL